MRRVFAPARLAYNPNGSAKIRRCSDQETYRVSCFGYLQSSKKSYVILTIGAAKQVPNFFETPFI